MGKKRHVSTSDMAAFSQLGLVFCLKLRKTCKLALIFAENLSRLPSFDIVKLGVHPLQTVGTDSHAARPRPPENSHDSCEP
jgi:hypothetical protein